MFDLSDPSLQGRKRVMGTLRQQLGARRSRNEPEHEVVDFFDLVIHELDRPDSELNENIALDLLFLMLFASHETTSIGLTAILKFPDRQPRSIAGTNGREIVAVALVY
jgi:cytochrome P450